MVAAGEDGASSTPSLELHSEVPQAPDKSTPAASPRKRGRPRKDEGKERKDVVGVVSGQKADTVMSKAEGEPGAASSRSKTEVKSRVEGTRHNPFKQFSRRVHVMLHSDRAGEGTCHIPFQQFMHHKLW